MSFPYCVQPGWEEKSRGPILLSSKLKRDASSILSFYLSSLTAQPRERHMADRISSRSSKTEPNDAKTKKNGKGSFIPESQIVLFLVSVPFPRPVLQPFHPYPSNLNSFLAWIE